MDPSAFRLLVEHAGDVIYHVDRRGHIRYVNAAVKSILGYDREEVIGRRAESFVAPGSGSHVRSFYARQREKRVEHTYLEVPVVACAGRLIWLGQHAHAARRNGRHDGFEIIARDVSEHRRVVDLQTGQKCLLELVARGKPLIEILDTLAFFLEAQLHESAVAVIVLDPSGNLLRPLVAPGLSRDAVHLVESAWESNLPIVEHLDVHPKERITVLDLQCDAHWQERSAATNLSYKTCWTVPVLSAERFAAGVIAVFRYDSGEPHGEEYGVLDVASQIAGVAIQRERMERTARIELKRRVAERTLELEQINRKLRQEIEDRREAERALLRSEGLLKEAERIAHIGSWSWHVAESSLLWSDETYRIFGVAPDRFDPTPRSILRLIHSEDRRRLRALMTANETGEPCTAEFRVLRPDGEERIVEVETSAKGEDDAARLFGVAHDITEQRQLERELVKAGERERKRVGRDLHDGLGQLLTGIGFLSKTLSQSLHARGDDDAEEASEITALVEDAIDHTRSLSKLLLPVELEENGLEAALQRLRSHVEGVYGIACKLKTDSYTPILDPEIALHMYRVAQEAVHNAVRHGRPTEVEIALSTRAGRTCLCVLDDGIGFPKGVDQRGGGLGLRTMQYRAQTVGATLTISRRGSGGTRVVCELPAHVEDGLEVTLEPILTGGIDG